MDPIPVENEALSSRVVCGSPHALSYASCDPDSLHSALSFAVQSGNYIAASKLHSRMFEMAREGIYKEFKSVLRGKVLSSLRIADLKNELFEALKQEVRRLLEEIDQRERAQLSDLRKEAQTRQERLVVTQQARDHDARLKNLPKLVELKNAEAKFVQYRQFHLAEGARSMHDKLLKQYREKGEIIAEAEKGHLIKKIEREASEQERQIREKYNAMRSNIDLFKAKREREIGTQISSKSSSDAKEVHKKIMTLNERKARLAVGQYSS